MAPTTPLSPARVLHLQRVVGRGGFGEVYEGSMTTAAGLARRVAVKVLRQDLADGADAVLRLRDEARMLSWLRHPVVASVEDLVELDGRPALISEFIEGWDLADVAPLPPRSAYEMTAKVAEALAAAWGQKGPNGRPMRIVHRDLKPANIRLGPHGVVKLLDFGIARAEDLTRAARTGTGLMVGSVGYLAPERWSGDTDSHQGDVYALGCVLYEALSGRSLFDGVTPQGQMAIALDEDRHHRFVTQRLSALPVDARGAMELLRGMTRHDPTQRPTATEVSQRAMDLTAGATGQGLLGWSEGRAPTARHEPLDQRWVERAGRFQPEASTPGRPKSTRAASWAAGVLATGLVALALMIGGFAALAFLVRPTGVSYTTAPEADLELIQEPALIHGHHEPVPDAETVPLSQEDPEDIDVPGLPEREQADVRDPNPRSATPRHSGPPPPAVNPSTPDPDLTRVSVEGALDLRLTGERGVYRPGPVPPGQYRLEARFEDGDWTVQGWIEVRTGAPVTVRCNSRFRTCL
jgi:tRNA A-37 threonylcarbamoyl transferase component Bud32